MSQILRRNSTLTNNVNSPAAESLAKSDESDTSSDASSIIFFTSEMSEQIIDLVLNAEQEELKEDADDFAQLITKNRRKKLSIADHSEIFGSSVLDISRSDVEPDKKELFTASFAKETPLIEQ